MSHDLRSRPSELLGCVDSFTAFCVDRAVWTLAKAIENEQEEAVNRLPKSAKEKAHRNAKQRILDKFLGVELDKAPQKFKAPTPREG
jgi:hypothetical protein